MNLSLSRHVFRVLPGSLVWLLAVSGAWAHEPFDLSSRLMVHADRLELISTMGQDGVRSLLAGAGLSPEEIAHSLKARGPEAIVDLPATLAPRLFLLKIDGEPLIAKSFTSRSEGVEIILTLIYPRPVAGNLEVRAACYETIPGLRKGMLFVHDESAGRLGAALLSPARAFLALSLPVAGQRTNKAAADAAVFVQPRR